MYTLQELSAVFRVLMPPSSASLNYISCEDVSSFLPAALHCFLQQLLDTSYSISAGTWFKGASSQRDVNAYHNWPLKNKKEIIPFSWACIQHAAQALCNFCAWEWFYCLRALSITANGKSSADVLEILKMHPKLACRSDILLPSLIEPKTRPQFYKLLETNTT